MLIEKDFLKLKNHRMKKKTRLANAIIKRTNLHKSLFDMAEEIMDEIGVTNKENRKIIHEMTKAMFNKEVDRDKLEEFIQTNCSMMEQ